MATRRERVVLDLEDHFTPGILRAAAATSLLNERVGSLSSHAVESRTASREMSRGLDEVGSSSERAARSIDNTGRSARSASADINQFSGRLRLLGETAAVLGPGLVPIGAIGIPAVAGLAAQFGFAAVGAGVAVAAFQGVGEALKAVNKAAIDPTVANLKHADLAMKAISPEARQLVEHLRTMGPMLKDLRDTAAKGMFPGLTEGLDALITRAPDVKRIMGAISGALGDIMEAGGKSLAGSQWDDFFTFLATDAPSALKDMARAAGNVAHAMAEMWMAFDPLNDSFSSWLVHVTAELDKWATGLDQTDGFAEFIDYVRANGPQVAATFVAIANAALQIAEAAAPLGGPVLRGIEAVAKAIAAIADSDLGTPIFTALAALVIYQRALGAVAALSKVAFLPGGGAKGGLRGGLAGGIAGAAKGGVVPVYVTNPGFGGTPTGGVPGAAGKAGSAAAVATEGAAVASALKFVSLRIAGAAALMAIGDRGNEVQRAGTGKHPGDRGLIDPNTLTPKQLASLTEGQKRMLGLDKAARQAAQGQRTANAALSAAGSIMAASSPKLAKYGRALQDLPKAVRTKVETPGAVTSMADVRRLAKQYDLTPKQVRTLVQLSGAKPAKNATDQLIRSLTTAGRQRPRPNVAVTGAGGATAAAFGVARAINSIPRSHTTTIRVNRVGSAAFNAGAGFIPKADGGRVPGSGGPREDNILIAASAREWVQPVSAVDYYGESFMEAIRTRRFPRPEAFADGGQIGSLQSFASGGSVRREGSSDGRAQLRHRFHELSKAVYDSTKAIDRERSRRDALVAKRDELKGNVADKFKTDLFGDTSNVWAAGGGDTLGVLKADIAKAKAFQHTLKGLRQQGLNGDALADIASTGDIGKAQALASLGKSGIARYEKLYDQRTRAANQVGAYAGLAAYGTQIAKQTHELRKNFHELNAMKHHLALMRKELAHHPKKTGEAVGHAVNHAAAAGHRRKS